LPNGFRYLGDHGLSLCRTPYLVSETDRLGSANQDNCWPVLLNGREAHIATACITQLVKRLQKCCQIDNEKMRRDADRLQLIVSAAAIIVQPDLRNHHAASNTCSTGFFF